MQKYKSVYLYVTQYVYFRLQNYESCKNYAQQINEKIIEFKKLPSGSSQRAKVNINFFLL